MTTQRLAALEVLREPGIHRSVEQITAAIEARLQSVSVQAVCGALEALCGTGLPRRIEPPGSAALFEARVADDHRHLVCRRCSIVAEVDGGEITFWGICSNWRSPVSQSTTARTKEPVHA